MGVEAGIPGAVAILELAVTRDGHQQRFPEIEVLAQTARHLQAVQLGKADVEQDHVGTEGPRLLHGCQAVMGGMDLMAAQAEQQGQAVGCVAVVIDDQDSLRGCLCEGSS